MDEDCLIREHKAPGDKEPRQLDISRDLSDDVNISGYGGNTRTYMAIFSRPLRLSIKAAKSNLINAAIALYFSLVLGPFTG